MLWFERKLRSSTCAIFVGMDGPLPCGQVRFDWDALGEAEVDVSVDRALRGVGLGSVLLHCAAVEVFTNTPTRVIHAHVKSANFASIRAFEKAGFRRGETALFNGHEAVHLILKRDNV